MDQGRKLDCEIAEPELKEALIAPDRIWPVTIVADRYNGVYSGALFLAIDCYPEHFPEAIGAGDSEEENFWLDRDKNAKPLIGKGRTPNEALADLQLLIHESQTRI